jgi:hypothetical protein
MPPWSTLAWFFRFPAFLGDLARFRGQGVLFGSRCSASPWGASDLRPELASPLEAPLTLQLRLGRLPFYGVALVTDLSQSRGYCARMAPEDIQHLIDRAIRDHEMRVALWSGLLGALLMAGTWHAIWLCR